jgi:hypothetical protein
MLSVFVCPAIGFVDDWLWLADSAESRCAATASLYLHILTECQNLPGVGCFICLCSPVSSSGPFGISCSACFDRTPKIRIRDAEQDFMLVVVFPLR